jgi:L-serine dehydratase
MKMLSSPRKIKASCGSDAYVAPQDLGASRDVGVAPTEGVDGCHCRELFQPFPFNEKGDLLFQRKVLPYHSNGMRFTVFDHAAAELLQKDYYSVGGGFVVTGDTAAADRLTDDDTCLPYPFKSADALLKLCTTHNKPISALMYNNEKAWLGEQAIRKNLLTIWQVMQACVERGMHQEGTLPGGMKIKRRAANLYQQLTGAIPRQTPGVPVGTLDWINLFAHGGQRGKCRRR